jgi:DNA-binding response OmpR family regulator
MTKRLYESAQTVVYDPVASNRTATRASLHSLGFRKVELTPSLDMLAACLKEKSPDLMFAEVSGAETEVCNLIQTVRQGLLGRNPFIVAIVTTWRRDGTIVGKVLNSGADDLVARPFSTQVMGERIKAQVERRKGFVVTSDYIGPDRRRDPSRPGLPCIEVPNSLRVRTIEGVPEEEAERRVAEEVERGKGTLNGQKIRRDAVQLCVQWRLLEHRNRGTRDFFDILTRLDRIAGEIKRRSADAADDSAAGWCGTIASSVESINAMSSRTDPGKVDTAPNFAAVLSQLGHAALSIGKLFAPEETESAKLDEIEALIARKQVQAA